MKEHCVSLEVAKLLKEKGFNEVCRNYWGGFNEEPLCLCECNSGKAFDHCWNTMLEEDYCDYRQTYIAAPKLEEAMDWLRWKHCLHCQVVIKELTDYAAVEYVYAIADLGFHKHWIRGEYKSYKSYDEACNAAILYCLKHEI